MNTRTLKKTKSAITSAEQNKRKPVVSTRVAADLNEEFLKLCAARKLDRASVVSKLVADYIEEQKKPISHSDCGVIPVKFSRAPDDVAFMRWLCNPKHRIEAFLEPKLVHFTPELVAAVVERTCAVYANVRDPEHHSKKIQRLMRANKFGTSKAFRVVFDRSGYAIDGLGRLHAMMLYGGTFDYWVEVVDDTDAEFVRRYSDSHNPRKLYVRIADKLGHEYDARRAATPPEKRAAKKRCTKIMNCVTNYCTDFYRDQHDVDPKEAIECLEQHHAAMRWAVDSTFGQHVEQPHQKGPVIAAFAKLYEINPRKAQAFCELVTSRSTANNPASVFGNWMMQTSTAGASRIPRVHSVALTCFKAFCRNEKMPKALNDEDAKQIELDYKAKH